MKNDLWPRDCGWVHPQQNFDRCVAAKGRAEIHIPDTQASTQTEVMDLELLQAIRAIVREELGHRDDELLDAEGLAAALKVPVSWVYESSRTGRIPTVRVGKYVRFRLNDVLKGGS